MTPKRVLIKESRSAAAVEGVKDYVQNHLLAVRDSVADRSGGGPELESVINAT
jgi:hypothetical protein